MISKSQNQRCFWLLGTANIGYMDNFLLNSLSIRLSYVLTMNLSVCLNDLIWHYASPIYNIIQVLIDYAGCFSFIEVFRINLSNLVAASYRNV